MQSKGLSRVFSNTTVPKHQFFSAQLSLVQFSHPYMTTGKTIALNRQTFVGTHPHIYTHIYIMECYSVIKKNEILPFATIWMDLEAIMLSEICQTEKDKYYIISLTCRI